MMEAPRTPHRGSAFSDIYLDRQTKDLLSLKSLRRVSETPLDSKAGTVILNQRESTVHAPTLINNLQKDASQSMSRSS